MDQNELDLQIAVCEDMIRHYKSERKKFMKLRTKYQARSKYQHQEELGELLSYLSTHPGADRQAIAQLFPEYTPKQLTNLLTLARRRFIIRNFGTRARPQWYLLTAAEIMATRK